MTNNDDWLTHFAAQLKGLHYPAVYWLSILLLILGLVGMLWSLPVPEEFVGISPLFNWGSALLMVTAVYYFIISLPLAIGLLPILLVISVIQASLAASALPVLAISIAAIGIAAIGFFVTRNSLRAVVRDCQLAMLAPAFLMSLVYRKCGIPI